MITNKRRCPDCGTTAPPLGECLSSIPPWHKCRCFECGRVTEAFRTSLEAEVDFYTHKAPAGAKDDVMTTKHTTLAPCGFCPPRKCDLMYARSDDGYITIFCDNSGVKCEYPWKDLDRCAEDWNQRPLLDAVRELRNQCLVMGKDAQKWEVSARDMADLLTKILTTHGGESDD